jgi:hypothetical protein
LRGICSRLECSIAHADCRYVAGNQAKHLHIKLDECLATLSGGDGILLQEDERLAQPIGAGGQASEIGVDTVYDRTRELGNRALTVVCEYERLVRGTQVRRSLSKREPQPQERIGLRITGNRYLLDLELLV